MTRGKLAQNFYANVLCRLHTVVRTPGGRAHAQRFAHRPRPPKERAREGYGRAPLGGHQEGRFVGTQTRGSGSPQFLGGESDGGHKALCPP